MRRLEQTRCKAWTSVAVAAVLVCVGAVGPSTVARGAAVVAADDVVKYYVVAASYAGQPETLTAIAKRYLGSGDRSSEIFNLNANRTQPDGARLTNPDQLRAGWVLVLPWDAVGAEVRQGIPPSAPASRPTTPPTQKPPTQNPPPPSPPSPPRGCAGTQAPGASTHDMWGQVRLAPERVWSRTRGDGVLVAIVDSGVDASLPELADRVSVGADIVAGTGRGNVDCLGTGTAMAGIIAGGAAQVSSGMGLAPGAHIVPVRIATEAPSASVENQAAAIDVAVSTGAAVLALGALVDIREPQVSAAVANATRHDVVVVVAAPTTPTAEPVAGLLRVGGVGIDGRIAETYASGAVDVVAPGVDVTSLGIAGTGDFRGSGTQYAVAFTAGEVALVRAMYPDQPAAWVVQRIKETAGPMGGSAPNPTYGWGLIDPDSATAPLPVDTALVPAEAGSRTMPMAAAVATAAIIAIIVILLVFRIRRAVRTAPSPDGEQAESGTDGLAGPPPNRGAPPGSLATSPTVPLPTRPRAQPPTEADTAPESTASSRFRSQAEASTTMAAGQNVSAYRTRQPDPGRLP